MSLLTCRTGALRSAFRIGSTTAGLAPTRAGSGWRAPCVGVCGGAVWTQQSGWARAAKPRHPYHRMRVALHRADGACQGARAWEHGREQMGRGDDEALASRMACSLVRGCAAALPPGLAPPHSCSPTPPGRVAHQTRTCGAVARECFAAAWTQPATHPTAPQWQAPSCRTSSWPWAVAAIHALMHQHTLPLIRSRQARDRRGCFLIMLSVHAMTVYMPNAAGKGAAGTPRCKMRRVDRRATLARPPSRQCMTGV